MLPDSKQAKECAWVWAVCQIASGKSEKDEKKGAAPSQTAPEYAPFEVRLPPIPLGPQSCADGARLRGKDVHLMIDLEGCLHLALPA